MPLFSDSRYVRDLLPASLYAQKSPRKVTPSLIRYFPLHQLTISVSKRCFLGELSEFDYSGARDTFTVISFWAA